MRVVSLVPSVTDTLFALGLDTEQVVGRTSWCIAPEPQVSHVRKVGGTRTPSLRTIEELEPDLVVLEREENTLATHEALAERGISTLVLHILRVADVPPALRRLGEAVNRAEQGGSLAAAAEAALERARACALRLGPGPCAQPLIWHEPLMGVTGDRYAGDLVQTVGFRIPRSDDPGGYPQLTPEELGARGVELLLLTSEPHDFTRKQGEAIADAVAAAGFPRPRAVKVDGQALTWFGARTAAALDWWIAYRDRLASGQ